MITSPEKTTNTTTVARQKPWVVPKWAKMAGVAVALLIAWFGWKHFHSGESGIGPVISGTVKRGDLIETISATGSVEPRTGAQVHIGTQIAGRIKRLYADVGDFVKAGSVIADLDLPDVTAQLELAKADNAAASSKLFQQKKNVTLGSTQTDSAISLAKAALNSAVQTLKSSQATATLQTVQTPSDIRKAEAALSQANKTLTTAQAALVQQDAGSALLAQVAKESLDQANANDAFNQQDLGRQQDLAAQGYVALTVVDKARQVALVTRSLVASAKHTLDLTTQKNTADHQAAVDVVSQADEGVKSAKAALTAANGEVFTTAARLADVAAAKAVTSEANANLKLALGNLVSNEVRLQDVRQASDALNASVDQVAVNKAQADRLEVRTPISGTVIQLAAQQGETLAAGLSAPTLIVVADLTRLEVDAYVDETDIGKVKIGQPAKISVDAFPGLAITGTVAKVASGSSIQQGVVTYIVTVYVNDSQQKLRPDMTANITIQTGKLTSVLLVPAEAVQVGVTTSTVNVLTVVDGKSSVTPTTVTTGGTDGISIQILTGLTEGQTIVLAGGQSTAAHAPSSSPFGAPGGGGGARGGGGGGRGG